jgi:hypothetical protein
MVDAVIVPHELRSVDSIKVEDVLGAWCGGPKCGHDRSSKYCSVH